MGNAGGLTTLPYHGEVVAFLQAKEPEVWAYVSEHRIERSNELRHDLLRSTYRIDRTGHPEVVAAADAAARALGVDVPVSLYQAEGAGSPNAMLVFVPDEAVIVLHGPVLELLEAAELPALFGHELAHHWLWSREGGDHLTADRIVSAMIADGALPERVETGRRLSLATEFLADRGALLACGDLHTAVATLVKISTTLRRVSPESYLAQAAEALAASESGSAHHTHPEMFFRAAALRAWAEGTDALATVERAIRGDLDIDRLDVIDQDTLGRRTAALIDEVTSVPMMRTDAVDGHRKAFFPVRPPRGEPSELSELSELSESHPLTDAGDRALSEATRRYLAYVLLDFASIDRDLELVSVQHAAAVARRYDLGELFTALAASELALSAADRARLAPQ